PTVTYTSNLTPVAPDTGNPTATVLFKEGATSLRTTTLSGGPTTYTNNTLSVGSHSITVVYTGDTNFNTNTSSALAQTVNKADSSTAVTSSASPGVFGQGIRFTATVSAVA